MLVSLQSRHLAFHLYQCVSVCETESCREKMIIYAPVVKAYLRDQSDVKITALAGDDTHTQMMIRQDITAERVHMFTHHKDVHTSPHLRRNTHIHLHPRCKFWEDEARTGARTYPVFSLQTGVAESVEVFELL